MKLSKRFDAQFTEVIKMIQQARYNAVKSVNTELVKLYWNIGKYVSGKLSSAEWGDSVVDLLADYIHLKHPEFKWSVVARQAFEKKLKGAELADDLRAIALARKEHKEGKTIPFEKLLRELGIEDKL